MQGTEHRHAQRTPIARPTDRSRGGGAERENVCACAAHRVPHHAADIRVQRRFASHVWLGARCMADIFEKIKAAGITRRKITNDRTDPRTKDQAIAAATSKISRLRSMPKISRARQCPRCGFQLGVTSRESGVRRRARRRLRTAASVASASQELSAQLRSIYRASLSSTSTTPKDRWGFVQVRLA
jgi:hypothetical protein